MADLLRAGAVTSWRQVGQALDISNTEARDEFAAWIAGQRNPPTHGSIGLTETEADQLRQLADAVAP